MGKWKAWELLLLVVVIGCTLLAILLVSSRYQIVDSTENRQSFLARESSRSRERRRRDLYHSRRVFELDYGEMLQRFKVYVYPHAFDVAEPFANVFIPHSDPYNPKLGNYFSEHMFKISLLNSSFLTANPEEANLFFLPFSINVMRHDARIRNEANISRFVAGYVGEVSRKFKFWNRTGGADHFYASCHSVGRDAASGSQALQRNAIQVTCSANHYQKFYVPHKDVSMPQVWPRPAAVNRLHKRNLAFFAGRAQNSRARQLLLKLWSRDPDILIYDGFVKGSYAEAFSSSKFCLHVKGYEVNTARISDALHYGCVPVIISDQYDLPFSNILDWKSFSVTVRTVDIPSLKSILQQITDSEYAQLQSSVHQVRKHFEWHSSAQQNDSFYMTMYQLWLRRHVMRPALLP